MDVVCDEKRENVIKCESNKRMAKTRRGLASRDINITECAPAADVYNDELNDIIQSKKQCELNIQTALETYLRDEERKEKNQANAKLLESNKDPDETDVSILSAPPSPVAIGPEIHDLIKDLESVKARYERKSIEEVDVEIVELVDEIYSDLSQQSIPLRILCRGQCHRLKVTMNDPFLAVIENIAKQHQTKPSRLNLFLRDKLIKPDDTPASINLDIADCIDGYIMTEDEVNIPSVDENDSADILNLKIQTKEIRSKVNIQIKKTDSMSVMMEKFAELTNFAIDRLSFSFDGEEIRPNDMPEELGLEDNYCIDVTVRNIGLK